MSFQFNPSNALFRWAWQKASDDLTIVKGDGATAGSWADINVMGEKLGVTAEVVQRTQITRNQMASRPLPGKLQTGGEVDMDAFNPAQDWRWFAALFGHCDAPEILETGAYRHRFHRSATDVNFPEVFMTRVWRDDGYAERFSECRVSQIVITFPTKGLISFKPTVITGRADYWGDPAPTGGNTSTAIPQVRGLVDQSFINEDVLFEVTATDSTTVTIKAKRGAPTSYGSGTQVIQKGAWTWMLDEAGHVIGDRGSKAELYLPLTGTYVVNDEWTLPATVPIVSGLPWVPSFSPDGANNEVYGQIDGGSFTELEVDSATLTITNPAEAKYGYGGRLPKRTRVRGQQKVTAALTREYQAKNFRRELETGRTAPFTLTTHSGVTLGSSGQYDYSASFFLPGATITGKSASAEGIATMNEPINIEGFFPSGNGSFPDDIYVDIINNIADLTAV